MNVTEGPSGFKCHGVACWVRVRKARMHSSWVPSHGRADCCWCHVLLVMLRKSPPAITSPHGCRLGLDVTLTDAVKLDYIQLSISLRKSKVGKETAAGRGGGRQGRGRGRGCPPWLTVTPAAMQGIGAAGATVLEAKLSATQEASTAAAAVTFLS